MIHKTATILVIALLLWGCGGSGPGVKITSVKYVDSINTSGGVSYNYEGKEIIEINLDFSFDESIAADLDPTREDYRGELFKLLATGAHFYLADEEVKRTYGYWPEEAGKDFAKDMTLFYVVPIGHSVEDLKFVYDGSVLGEGAKSLDTEITPSR